MSVVVRTLQRDSTYEVAGLQKALHDTLASQPSGADEENEGFVDSHSTE